MKHILILLMLTFGYSQVTLTQEQADNIAHNIQELQIKADSLFVTDSLKTLEVVLLNDKVALLEEDLALTEKKVKLVKPSWWENKWLYFGYGSVLGVSVTLLINQLGDVINIF